MTQPQPDYRLAGTHGNTDTAYTTTNRPTPIDPATLGLLWRLGDNFTTMAEHYVRARDAAAHGPGQPDTHVLTRHRGPRDPARMTAHGTLADIEATEWRRRIRNARRRLRYLAEELERDIARPITDRHDPDPDDPGDDVEDDG